MGLLAISVVMLSFGGLVLAISYVIGVYNALARGASSCDTAWYDIDVLLQQRHDELIERLGAGHTTTADDLLARVVALRADYDGAPTMHDKVRAENELNRLLCQAHPGRTRVSGLEALIADRREFFNDSAHVHNQRLARFPDLLVARPLGYREQAVLEVPADTQRDVAVGLDEPALAR